MTLQRYRYEFLSHVRFDEVEASLALAIGSTEAIHGESQVRLDFSYDLDARARTCLLDAGTPAGLDVNRLFVGIIRKQFGEDAFVVDRLGAPQEATT
jgi:hypothetical protein